jgi:hypothetical protein
MNRDDIIRMAREAGLHIATDHAWMPIIGLAYAQKFAELVRADEREACAKVCENGTFLHDFSPEAVYSRACARAIRARGQV